MPAFYAYMLRCADGSFYVGHTDELEKRVWEHQEGIFPGFTSRRRPVELVWACDCPTRDEAKETEQRVKPWSRRKKEALIRGDWAELKRAARGKNAWERRTQR
ncbi:MAG: GIY-YIG nuclease family protein [Anaeromyxobacteraceae bacterium]